MKLKLKLSVCFDFIRCERHYFLILLLTLGVILFNQDFSSSEPTFSTGIDQVVQTTKEWEESFQSIPGLVILFVQRPIAAMACALLLALFAGLIFGGVFILISMKLMPSILQWFQNNQRQISETRWKGVIFFRVLILIFAVIIISGAVIARLWLENSQNENLIGLFHTLAIDLLVCFSIYVVVSDAGLKQNFFSSFTQVSYGQEIKRGMAGYVMTFPIFIFILVFALGIAEWLHYEPPLHPLVKIFIEEDGRSQFVFQFALILAAIAAPILEEFFFRGFCYRLFRSWWGAPGAAALSAAFFAAIHGSGFAFFPIFVLGLALAWLYEKRGNLTACWTFHVLHNILFTSYFFSIKSFLGVSA